MDVFVEFLDKLLVKSLNEFMTYLTEFHDKVLRHLFIVLLFNINFNKNTELKFLNATYIIRNSFHNY